MKRMILCAMVFLYLSVASVVFAAGTRTYYVQVHPTLATYNQTIDAGVTNYQRTEVSKLFDKMGFSGTSTCQVIDVNDWDIDGYWTFQFKYLTGATMHMPLSGTTISVHWRGTNVDSPGAWTSATKNTIINGINARTGATNVGYDIDAISGVTPFRYLRIEYESGINAGTNGNLIPIGVLYVR